MLSTIIFSTKTRFFWCIFNSINHLIYYSKLLLLIVIFGTILYLIFLNIDEMISDPKFKPIISMFMALASMGALVDHSLTKDSLVAMVMVGCGHAQGDRDRS